MRQNMDFATNRHLAGGGGAFAFVALDVSHDGRRSRCYAKRCRETLASRASAECPHLHTLREKSGVASDGQVAIPPGRSLDGFLLLTGVDVAAALPARVCLAAGCRDRPGASPANGVGLHDEEAVAQEEGDAEVEPRGGDGSDVEAGELDGEADECGSVDTWPVDLDDYVPSVRDILCMSREALTQLSHFHDLPERDLSHSLIRHQLVEHFHPGEVGQLASYYSEAVPSGRRRRKSRRGEDADAAPSQTEWRVAHRTRWCVDGAMCREHASQKAAAVARLDALQALHDAEAELEAAAREAEACDDGLQCSPCREDDDDAEVSGAAEDDDDAHRVDKCRNCKATPCWLDEDGRCVACDHRVRRSNHPTRVRHAPHRLHAPVGAGTSDATPATCGSTTSHEAAASEAAAEAVTFSRGYSFELPILALSPSQVDDFLHAILLARARRTSPVIPLTDDLYAVLRSEYSEGGYRCPGGYSLVSIRLHQLHIPNVDSSREQATRLHIHCTCSEFHSCRSSLGGKSKSGATRVCTCCLMVLAANALASPDARLLHACSLWLHAVRVPVSDPMTWASLLDGGGGGEGHAAAAAAAAAASASCPSMDALVDGPKLPETWEPRQRLEWKALTGKLEASACSEGVAAVKARGLQTVFPSVIRPLPINAPACPCCVDADGKPRPLQQHRRSTEAYIFIGQLVLRQPVEVWYCTSTTHGEAAAGGPQVRRGFVSRARRDGSGHDILPMGAAWTQATALFNNSNAWFFSVLLLDEVTDLVRANTTAQVACRHVLRRSYQNMADLGVARDSLPDIALAGDKMWDAWFTYEIVMKEVEYDKWCKCKKCGWLPCRTGSDACAKVAMNLSREAAWAHVDYTPQADDVPLWSQERLMRECLRWSTVRCMGDVGDKVAAGCPIPVDLVPPMFYSQNYAADEVHNTEALKRRSRPHVAVHKASLLPLALLVQRGELDIVALRAGTHDQKERLDHLLERCDVPQAERNKMNIGQQREWLLRAWDTLATGASHCHMFVSAKRGTGGTVTLCCPHGVVICYKFLFSQESNRDHDDLLRSLLLEPAVHWMDDSCGLMTFRQGMNPTEFAELYGPNRGCPRAWVAAPNPASCLQPLEIPELADEHIRREAVSNDALVAEAWAIRRGKGAMQRVRHPFLRGQHRWRLCLTDRLHQSVKKKSHKRDSCKQHLASIVATLARDNTSIMESLNSRLHSRLQTLCTLTPKRAIPFYHRITYWENRRIIEQQAAEFGDALLPGQKVVEPEPFGIALYVCEQCERPVGGLGENRCECTVPV